MKIIKFILLIIFCTNGLCSSENLKISIIKKNNIYELNLIHNGKGVIFSDPAKIDLVLISATKSGNITGTIRTGRSNKQWKHMVLLFGEKEDHPDLNSYAFTISENEIKDAFRVPAEKIKLIGVTLYCSSYEDFKRDGVTALTLTEIIHK